LKTAKEITIDYLKNIKKEKENIIKTGDWAPPYEPAKILLSYEIDCINVAIRAVIESEGE